MKAAQARRRQRRMENGAWRYGWRNTHGDSGEWFFQNQLQKKKGKGTPAT
jgi:hypothetical protein